MLQQQQDDKRPEETRRGESAMLGGLMNRTERKTPVEKEPEPLDTDIRTSTEADPTSGDYKTYAYTQGGDQVEIQRVRFTEVTDIKRAIMAQFEEKMKNGGEVAADNKQGAGGDLAELVGEAASVDLTSYEGVEQVVAGEEAKPAGGYEDEEESLEERVAREEAMVKRRMEAEKLALAIARIFAENARSILLAKKESVRGLKNEKEAQKEGVHFLVLKSAMTEMQDKFKQMGLTPKDADSPTGITFEKGDTNIVFIYAEGGNQAPVDEKTE